MRKIKTLLINPPLSTEALYGKFSRGGSDLPPLSLCYIASYLLKYGKQVDILDTAKLRLSITDINKKISEYEPDIIGFHTVTPYINLVKFLVSEIKSARPNILVIAGGPHFMGEPVNDIENSQLDIAVIGEGEQTCLEIVEGLEQSEINGFLLDLAPKIKGIVYKKNKNIYVNPPRELINDIDTIPLPARHLLPPLRTYKVSVVQYKRLPSTGVLTARGCPFKCIFCVCSVSRQKVRNHSVEYVMAEVDELIYRYGIRDITFIDDVFTLDKQRTYRICDELAKRKDKLTWSSNVRIGLVDKEMLKYMKDSGCWMVLVGVESGNQEILNRIKKQIKLEQAEQLSRWCKEAGLMFHPNYIIGHPGETVDTINQTINFAKKLYSHFPIFTIMTPYPGTELWDTAEEYGTLNKEDFSNFSLGSNKPCFVPYGLTDRLLVKKRSEAYRKCYLNFPMALRHFRSIKSFKDVKRMFDALNILSGL
ncbi:MAG: radical SAM protein [Candidatus Omnitrophica bacterium]|nr:radical SAM protein [Candidatus Omnitrophota bacterium]